jgi:hypothetical protein
MCNDEVAPVNLLVEFGEIGLYAPVRRNVVIKNIGNGPLQVTGLNISGGDSNHFSLDLNNQGLPGELAAGEEAVVIVEYNSGIAGDHNSSIQIQSDDSDESMITLDLSGRALAPRACVDPVSVDFGIVQTGETKTSSFTIENCGTTDLNIMNVAMNSSSSSFFSLLNLPSFPINLPTGSQAVEIMVEYAPQIVGDDLGGVDIFTDDPSSDPATDLTETVSLEGSGADQICSLEPHTDVIDFEGVSVGATKRSGVFLINVGSANCNIQEVQISQNTPDSEFSILTVMDPSYEILPGAGVGISVEYGPISLGQDSGVLSILSTDPNGEILVDMTGEGVQKNECDLQVTPWRIDFGTVSTGGTSAEYIMLDNLGYQECTVSDIEFKPNIFGLGDFTLPSSPQLPLILGANGQADSTYSLEVVFGPTQTGTHSAAVLVTSDDPDLNQSGGGVICGMTSINDGQACVFIYGSSEQ